ncbi:MAG: hypothetical protein KGZ97_02320 [Bacteroidetes bacterium]|nr:hypothetical protein [Bacteroidota bacterium]
MKKVILTLAIISMIICTVQSQVRIQRLHFITSTGQELELFVEEEKEVEEEVPAVTIEVLKEEQSKDLIGFDGNVFDLEIISTPEKEMEETIINTKALFEEFQNESKQASVI